MTVTRAQFEESLAELAAGVRDPRAGLFGPSSITWEVNRETAVFLGGGRAALLQTAHPFVAHGVEQHSKTRTDPFGRFLRTFDYVFAMVFGDLEHALSSSRKVFAIHQRIVGTIREDVGSHAEGSRYEANSEEALLWVAATLWDTSVQCFELLVRPLSLEEKERFFAEAKLFARLFGIPKSILPDTWGDFRAWFQERCDSPHITAGRAANELRGFLTTPPTRALGPVWMLYTNATAALLPPRIREHYGFAYGSLGKKTFEATVMALKLSNAALPARLRYLPAYTQAMARVSGKKPGVVLRAVTGAFQTAARRSRRAMHRRGAASA